MKKRDNLENIKDFESSKCECGSSYLCSDAVASYQSKQREWLVLTDQDQAPFARESSSHHSLPQGYSVS